MLGQIVVGTISNAPQLAPAEGEQELDIGGSLGIEGQLLGRMVTQTHILLLHAQSQQPVLAVASPVLEPLEIGIGLAEELKLHLLKLTGTEGEVAGISLRMLLPT